MLLICSWEVLAPVSHGWLHSLGHRLFTSLVRVVPRVSARAKTRPLQHRHSGRYTIHCSGLFMLKSHKTFLHTHRYNHASSPETRKQRWTTTLPSHHSRSTRPLRYVCTAPSVTLPPLAPPTSLNALCLLEERVANKHDVQVDMSSLHCFQESNSTQHFPETCKWRIHKGGDILDTNGILKVKAFFYKDPFVSFLTSDTY